MSSPVAFSSGSSAPVPSVSPSFANETDLLVELAAKKALLEASVAPPDADQLLAFLAAKRKELEATSSGPSSDSCVKERITLTVALVIPSPQRIKLGHPHFHPVKTGEVVSSPSASAFGSASTSLRTPTPPPRADSPTNVGGAPALPNSSPPPRLETPHPDHESLQGPSPAPRPETPPPNSTVPTGIIRTPADYHYPDFVDRNLKPDGEPKKPLKKLFNKKLNTMINTPDSQGDISQVRAKRLAPNENNEIVVKRRRIGKRFESQIALPESAAGGKAPVVESERCFILHPEPNPYGENRLIPVKGDGMYPMTGPQLEAHVLSYKEYKKQNPTATFASYLVNCVS